MKGPSQSLGDRSAVGDDIDRGSVPPLTGSGRAAIIGIWGAGDAGVPAPASVAPREAAEAAPVWVPAPRRKNAITKPENTA